MAMVMMVTAVSPAAYMVIKHFVHVPALSTVREKISQLVRTNDITFRDLGEIPRIIAAYRKRNEYQGMFRAVLAVDAMSLKPSMAINRDAAGIFVLGSVDPLDVSDEDASRMGRI
jgi:hypothetical protein